jgi:hypothetical protein
MKSTSIVFFIVFAIAFSAISCKKESLTPKELLSANQWKFYSFKKNGVEQPIADCQKDDIMTFSADGAYTYSIGIIMCDSRETDIFGVWTLSDDGKKITTVLTMYATQTIMPITTTESIEITKNKLVITILDHYDGWLETTLVPVK